MGAQMELNFDHGFVPRIDKRNWSGVDRALGPPGRLPLGDGVDLEWAVVDHAYAHVRPEMTQALRDHDVQVLYDSSAWRYREPETFSIESMTEAPYAPKRPIEAPGDEVRSFVEADLRSQAALGASAYMIPGFVPRDRHDDVAALTLQAVDVALGMQDLSPLPLIAFVGVHASRIEHGLKLLDRLSRSVAGVYIQLTPFQPQTDTVSKLTRSADLFRAASGEFTVIAGRAGGAGSFFRALGAHATDAGLAEGERFDFGSKAHPRKPTKGVEGKGFGRRVYLPSIGLSVSGKLFRLLTDTPGLQHIVRCSLPCCQFQPFSTKRAVEHSLRARVAEAAEHLATPPARRVESLLDLVSRRRAALDGCNATLEALGERALNSQHLEHQAAALARHLARSAAA